MTIITRNVFCKKTKAWDLKQWARWICAFIYLQCSFPYRLPVYLHEHPQINSLTPLTLLKFLCLLQHVWHSRCSIRLFPLSAVCIKTLVQHGQGFLGRIILDKRYLNSTQKINDILTRNSNSINPAMMYPAAWRDTLLPGSITTCCLSLELFVPYHLQILLIFAFNLGKIFIRECGHNT